MHRRYASIQASTCDSFRLVPTRKRHQTIESLLRMALDVRVCGSVEVLFGISASRSTRPHRRRPNFAVNVALDQQA
jgi:hypothetical protein